MAGGEGATAAARACAGGDGLVRALSLGLFDIEPEIDFLCPLLPSLIEFDLTAVGEEGLPPCWVGGFDVSV